MLIFDLIPIYIFFYIIETLAVYSIFCQFNLLHTPFLQTVSLTKWNPQVDCLLVWKPVETPCEVSPKFPMQGNEVELSG